jgi:cysteinyl-tRNA synthetase
MALRVHNTLTGKVEDFTPLHPPKVGMYVCGVTVYDRSHIGHARALVCFDVVYRYLKFSGYDVTFVRNFTDVDDKIIKRGLERGLTAQEVSEANIASFREDMQVLGCAAPHVEPKATEHIAEMIQLIRELEAKGLAYPSHGDVYFAVDKLPSYGQLSGRRLDDMQAGARIEVDEQKRHPMDFALWKASKPGEPFWDSPWGPGRPGWHIECSAMVEKHLPDGADIHGGGTDLRFPHHENELAQSAGAHPDHPFVRAWAHHGMVQMAEDKMAKSLGNIVDVKEAVERYGANAVRMWFLQSHYSQPIDYSEGILDEKRRSYERLLRLYRQISDSESSSEPDASLAAELRERFDAAMQDDLNTPEAVAAIFEVAVRAGREVSGRPGAAREFSSLVEALRDVLTIFGFDLKEELATEVDGVRVRYDEDPGGDVLRRTAERERARREKDWASADRLRDELHVEGWTVEDTPEGPVLSRR